jgi:hypothetical protein
MSFFVLEADLCIAADAIVATIAYSDEIISSNIMEEISFACGGEHEVGQNV